MERETGVVGPSANQAVEFVYRLGKRSIRPHWGTDMRVKMGGPEPFKLWDSPPWIQAVDIVRARPSRYAATAPGTPSK